MPLEQAHEQVHHSAEHSSERWISWVALSTALLAVLAAIAGLLSGKHANEAMMSQIDAADHWAYYQAKGIKAAVLDAKMALGGAAQEQDRTKAERYQEEQQEIERRRGRRPKPSQFSSTRNFRAWRNMFQIAIAIAAISALTKKRKFWGVSLIFCLAGCVF